jgi:5-methyltetrahydrofolate--homocysteine methyltransferase
MDALTTLLLEKDVVIADGATGTNLFEMGLANGDSGELWCVQHPDRVRELHQSFIDSGADVLLTNSFSSNRYRFRLHGMDGRVAELARAAAELAREVAERAPRKVVVAGSMGPTGEMIEPLGDCSQAQAREAFQEQAEALKAGGADVAWIETMFSEEELGAALQGAHAAGLPVVATMTFDTGGRTMMGLTPQQAAVNVRRHGVAPLAFGANCGMGPAQLLDTVMGILRGAEPGDVIVAKGNAGLPHMGSDMRVSYDGTPQIMADYACLARDAGVRIIGGCCGTSPVHLRAMAEALALRQRGIPPTLEEVEQKLGPVNPVPAGGGEEAPRRRRRRRQ